MGSILLDSLDYSMLTGDSIRVKECDTCLGQGRSMAVQITRKEDGFLWHCHRCRMRGEPRCSGFFRDRGASPQQVQELTKNGAKTKENNRPERVVLPGDFSTTLPPKALVQMYDLGLEDSDLERFDIGWSPSRARIIVPIYKYWSASGGGWAKKLIGVVGRKVDDGNDDKPKWWSQRQKDIKHPRFIGISKTILYPKQVVIVEDVFSAIRIASTGRISIALLTTYLPYELYPTLKGWDVRIWLDADAFTKSTKYQAALGQAAVTATTILTKEDPKTYSNNDINQAITQGRL